MQDNTVSSSDDKNQEMPKHGRDEDMEISSAGSGGLGSAASGGFGSDMGPNVIIPRPRNFKNSGTLNFHQLHRFVSRGVAYTPSAIAAEGVTTADLLMFTPLAEIPWDRAFLYLTARDLSSLPQGSYAKNVRIKITVRNPQIGFETNVSDSDLATLNHNKHMITAVGLNKRVLGTSRRLSFLEGAPMVPVTSTFSQYGDLRTAMYGYPNNNALIDSTVPASLFGVDIPLDNYYTCYNTSFLGSTVLNTQHAGWPSLIEHIDEFNMNDVIGSTVVDESYTFKCAPLKPQLGAIFPLPLDRGSPQFNVGSRTVQSGRLATASLPNTATSNTSDSFIVVNSSKSLFDAISTAPIDRHLTLLEQGQICKKINQTDSDIVVQPSVHVAMKPIPKIGNNILATPVAWTTVHAFYEVETFMEVGFAMPNHFSHGTGHNVEIESIMLATDGVIDNTSPIIYDKYPTS